ncbi:MAG: peptide chain release factor N(5)-glutamine methyltransferase [Verrucomicrobiota bacterium]|nr:peptide chain release factor N(5)-glutamine methyltransferase [Verrucomicrobiota bacterium]
MQTVLEIITKSAEWLGTKGVEKPRLDAELLLAHVLKCKRLDLYLRHDDVVRDPALSLLREVVRRRGKREPLAYILGETEFFNLKLKCDARALVPRPETEELVELVTELLTTPPATLLDLGTGTGALALALAKHWPQCIAVAVDTSGEALALATENAKANALETRVNLRLSDWFSAVPERFPLIVSNPPYLTEEELISAQPEVREFEPHSALTAPNAGLADLLRIIAEAREHLEPGGLLAMETGIAQHSALAAAASAGYSRWESRKDLAKRERFFLAWA